jgi:hypothetical protein
MQLKFLILFTTCVFSQSLVAQEQETLGKFIIQDARLNNSDISESVIDEGKYLVFYKTKEKEFFFAIVNGKNDNQTYGRVFNFETKSNDETDTEYKSDIFTFNWSYKRSFDDRRGTADVSFIKIYKSVGVTFSVSIYFENLDHLEYKGYMKGSIKVKED